MVTPGRSGHLHDERLCGHQWRADGEKNLSDTDFPISFIHYIPKFNVFPFHSMHVFFVWGSVISRRRGGAGAPGLRATHLDLGGGR